jgi:hypothetical protein
MLSCAGNKCNKISKTGVHEGAASSKWLFRAAQGPAASKMD